MDRAIPVLLIVTLIAGAPAGDLRAQEPFSFYGLTFGMTRAETKAVFPEQDGSSVLNPGHGMSTLEILFDREGLLMEIRAGYLRPEEKFKSIGLTRALREKFLVPVKETHPDIEVTLDEYANRAAVTLVLQSSGIREKNIEHYKSEYLNALE